MSATLTPTAPVTGTADPWRHWHAAEWPERCLAAERLFGQRHARLFPLMAAGHPDPLVAARLPAGRVNSTAGPGRLLSVFRDVCHVALDDAPMRRGRRQVAFLHPADIWPVEVEGVRR